MLPRSLCYRTSRIMSPSELPSQLAICYHTGLKRSRGSKQIQFRPRSKALGRFTDPSPPLCPVCEAYGILSTRTTKTPLFGQDMSAWLTPSPPPSWGAKTELLTQPKLEVLTRPFKMRRLIVRPIGGTLRVPLNLLLN